MSAKCSGSWNVVVSCFCDHCVLCDLCVKSVIMEMICLSRRDSGLANRCEPLRRGAKPPAAKDQSRAKTLSRQDPQRVLRLPVNGSHKGHEVHGGHEERGMSES